MIGEKTMAMASRQELQKAARNKSDRSQSTVISGLYRWESWAISPPIRNGLFSAN